MTSQLDQLSLNERVAIVTGGSRGIGRSVAELLSAMGATVVINYAHNAGAAAETVNRIHGSGGKSLAVEADVSKPSEARHLIQKTTDHFSRLDIVVCSAGIWEGSPVETMTEEMWDRTLEINLKGTWAVCQAAIPALKRSRYGRIVVISSTAGQRGEAFYANYAASKAGQIGFVKSLAVELGGWGITVNAVAPGWVDTEMTAEALGDAEERKAIAASIPIGAIAQPEDIAGPVAFLCTDWAQHITGEVLNVNGGSVLCG